LKYSHLALAIAFLAAVSSGAFVATRSIIGNSESQADPQVPEATPLVREDINEGERPRFEGELLGLFIAPSEDRVPSAYKEKHESLRGDLPPCSGSHRENSFGKAGDFHLSFELSESFVPDAVKSGVIVCDESGRPGSAHWEFKTAFNGFSGSVRVVRGCYRCRR